MALGWRGSWWWWWVVGGVMRGGGVETLTHRHGIDVLSQFTILAVNRTKLVIVRNIAHLVSASTGLSQVKSEG